MRLIVLGVLEQDLVHVGAGILEQLVGVVEDDEGDLAVTQDTQLIRLLHQTKLPFGERHLVEEETGGGEGEVEKKRNKIWMFVNVSFSISNK